MLDTISIIVFITKMLFFDSKLTFQNLPKSSADLAKSGPDFLLNFETSVSTKIGARSDKIGARFCANVEKQKHIFIVRFVPNFEGFISL